MSQAALATFVLKALVGVYAWMLGLSTIGVINCEMRKPLACGPQWAQAFSVTGSVAGTLLAYITDSPAQTRKRSDSEPS